MKYQAPAHTSGIGLPSGYLACDDAGVLDMPDDMPEVALYALAVSGFTLITEAPAPAPVSKPAKASPDAA